MVRPGAAAAAAAAASLLDVGRRVHVSALYNKYEVFQMFRDQ